MRFTFHAIPVLAALALAAIPVAHAQTAILDGKAFVAEAGERGKPVEEKNDILTFAGGKFTRARATSTDSARATTAPRLRATR